MFQVYLVARLPFCYKPSVMIFKCKCHMLVTARSLAYSVVTVTTPILDLLCSYVGMLIFIYMYDASRAVSMDT